MSPVPVLRWCPECDAAFSPTTTGHRFCSVGCRRRNGRVRRLDVGAVELEQGLLDLVRLLRAGGPKPATQVAVSALHGLLRDYSAFHGRLNTDGCLGPRDDPA